MGLTPRVPRWPAAAVKDGEPHSCLQRVCHKSGCHTWTISFLSPVLPWFETKHINTFRQLDCMNLGVLCVYLPLPHAITSPHLCGRRSSPPPQELIPASTLKKSEPHEWAEVQRKPRLLSLGANP